MQQQSTTAPSSGSASFAGLLAALAAPSSARAERLDAWNDDDLGEDVATLSYERALRAHSRYRPPEPGMGELADRLHPEVARICDALPGEQSASTPPARASEQAPMAESPAPEAASSFSAELDRNLKSASVTIRMSKAECAQLHRRAAEAGLTVSAYLRSCTFEAESLRAMVKDTLAQLRTAKASEGREAHAPSKRLRFAWLFQLWPYARLRQQVARA